jgi:toxin ParE1/3/4
VTQLTIHISTLARTDLKNIGRYAAQQWGIEQRNHYLLRFDERFKILSQNPKMGHCCDEIREGYRRFREGEHVIFYRLTEKMNSLNYFPRVHDIIFIKYFFNLTHIVNFHW